MVKEPEPWTISISKWGGFCPAYFDNGWSFYGNKNQATTITDIDLRDPNVLTQGPGMLVDTSLTGGTQAGELGSNLIVGITKHALSSDAAYACGAASVFKITSTAVSNTNFPKTITAGTANVSTDVLIYQGKVLVFWNDTGVDGDIGLLTNDTTWDDNWGSTVGTGAAQLQDAPHYGIVGGDDVAYITNGYYIATVDGTTKNVTALDFFTDSKTVSVSWNENRVIIALNRPNVTGSNYNLSAIYRWNGVSSSWEGDPIEVGGEIGALFTENGITYVWWRDAITTGGYNFGYINGTRLERIRRYSGSLPNQAQVGFYDGFIGWISSNVLVLWGSKDKDLPVNFFRFITPTYATAGTWAAPFGTPLISSTASTNYNIAKASGYSKGARYNTMAYNMRIPGWKCQIDLVQLGFETLATGAKVDTTITYNQGASTLALDQVAYSASDSSTFRKIYNGGLQCDDFRIDFSWTNGSTTNPFKIRTLLMTGIWIKIN